MYEMILEKSPNYDGSEEVYNSDIRDIANSLASVIEDQLELNVTENRIVFRSNLPAKKIKQSMRDVFSYHFDSVRFVSMNDS